MSTYTKSSTAIKEKRKEEIPRPEGAEFDSAKIIPWPDLDQIVKPPRKPKRKELHLEGKYLHHRGKKIPILQFQKSGYDKLLKLLIKEIEG
ncbi:MAG: hypothetical protein WCC06_01145 [Candidatus Aminicenantales bacterium]